MLALVLACSISAGGVRAQTFLTNTEYNFRVQHVTDKQAFNNNGDPIPVLSMSCLAANGYGQWTLSSTQGSSLSDGSGAIGPAMYPPGWYLLANGLYAPCVGYESSDPNHPYCIPPGVVQCGSLSLPTFTAVPQAKVVTNLDGMVDFIWANSGGTGFVQSGFTAADVDLSLSFLSNPQPVTQVVPTPTGNMNIIPTTNPIHSWPTITIPSTVTTEADDWRDEFDVCADAMYIYIVWTSTDQKIWVAVVPIGSSTPWGIWEVANIGNWQNPTITCDPRNNRGNPSYPNPAFDLSFISNFSGPTNQIWVGSWSASTSWYNIGFLSQNYWNPNSSTPSPETWAAPYHARIIRNSVNGGTSSLAVYATVANSVTTLAGDGAKDCWLIFYPPSNIFGTANYVAGTEMSAPILEGQTSPMSTPNPPIRDNPIIAFADPYDNQSGWHSTDEFHCLYLYDLSTTSLPGLEWYPLCIVRGSDVSAAYPPQPDGGIDDTRLVLTQAGGSLTEYPTGNGTINCWFVAAVNQMGIHVHWRTADNVHFYARDMNRTFDEGIDENTLVTDSCIVSNGASHGGTAGAILGAPGLLEEGNDWTNTRMTVWTDPNYGPPSEDGSMGLYSPYGIYSPLWFSPLLPPPPYIGKLTFKCDDVSLQIGSDGRYGMTLAVMPFFMFDFLGTGQSVTVNYLSTFDYYGLFATHNGSGVQTSIGTPFTNGTSDGEGAGTIDLEGAEDEYGFLYAYLNVHGGADFYTGQGGTLISNYGAINVMREPSVYPAPATSHTLGNVAATGHMTLYGTTLLQNYSTITGNAPGITSTYPGVDVIITSFGNFTATGCYFSNYAYSSYNLGLSTIQFGDYPINSSFESATITSNFVAANILALNPNCLSSLIISSTFDQIRNYAVKVVAQPFDPAKNPIPTISISGNYFLGFAPNAASGVYTVPQFSELPTLYGIWLQNFAHVPANTVQCLNPESPNYAPWNTINISENTFTQTGNYNDTLVDNFVDDMLPDMDFDSYPTSAAILLDNTTANVTSNTIEDNGYSVGIGALAVPMISYVTPNTSSLICSNTISGLKSGTTLHEPSYHEEVGMLVTNFKGYIQNNTITNCDNGFGSSGDDNDPLITHFICNTLSGNSHITLEANDNATIDMSGIHSPNSTDIPLYDMAGFNTISGPSTWVSTPTPDPNSENEVKLICIFHDPEGTINLSNSLQSWPWTNYGNNAIILTPANSSGNQPLIWAGNSSVAPILNVDHNYFAIGTTPIDPSNGICTGGATCTSPCTSTPYNWPGYGSENDAYNITYCASISATVPLSATLLSLAPWANGCQNWVTILADGMKKKGPSTLSLDTISCGHLLNLGNSLNQFQEWQASYDTLQLFIDSCANTPNSENAFGALGDDVQNFGVPNNFPLDSTIEAQYRAWLYSVLYLNTTDPAYFCICVGNIFNSFAYAVNDTTEQQRFLSGNMQVAFDRWVILNTNCAASEQDSVDILQLRKEQLQLWLQDSIDGIHYPYDTTVPTISQIGYGLDTLLARHFLYASVSNPPQPGIITNATANPNPANSGTVISFSIAKEAYVKIELYDVLGREASSYGYESLLEPGNKSVSFSLQGLPSGTYYARIITAYGEVQTVKLVKE